MTANCNGGFFDEGACTFCRKIEDSQGSPGLDWIHTEGKMIEQSRCDCILCNSHRKSVELRVNWRGEHTEDNGGC
jgi:hypothetical protein